MKKYGAPVALSFRSKETDLSRIETFCHSTGWKHHHWPFDVVRPGLRFYGFDMNSRQFFALLEITRGGAFRYSSLKEFTMNVKRMIGWLPDETDRHWGAIPRGRQNYGIAVRWRLIGEVKIPWIGTFPRIGWLRLDDVGLFSVHQTLESAAEGDAFVRRHLPYERNPRLGARSRLMTR